jgi:hypothetical protein
MTGPASKLAATEQAPWAFAAPWGARGYVTDLDGLGRADIHTGLAGQAFHAYRGPGRRLRRNGKCSN